MPRMPTGCWGARGFYTQAGSYSDIPLRAVARAALGDTAVIRLEAWRDFTPEDLPGTRVLHLSPAGLTALVARIEADLGPPMPIAAAGLTGRDAFFAARGRFSALRTCNVWVGEALRAADLSLGRWTPTPQALRLSLWWNGSEIRFFVEKSALVLPGARRSEGLVRTP